MLREIVIDTETTGLDATNGDRLIELGCIEIVNRIPTGREFHRYLNPERDIHPRRRRRARPDARLPEGQAAVQGRRRRVPRLHRRRAARRPQRLLRHRLHQCRAGAPGRAAADARPRGRHACRWRGAAIRPGPTASMRCASATASTLPSAPSTARCSNSLLLANVYVELLGERQATLGLGGQDGAEPRCQLRVAAGTAAPAAAAAAAHPRPKTCAPRVRQDAGRQGALGCSFRAGSALSSTRATAADIER